MLIYQFDPRYTRINDLMDLWLRRHEMGRLIIGGASEKFDAGSTLGSLAGPLPAGAKWKKNTGDKVHSPKNQFVAQTFSHLYHVFKVFCIFIGKSPSRLCYFRPFIKLNQANL